MSIILMRLSILLMVHLPNYRYITTYLKNTDLIRVTGYLVKKSEVERFRKGEAVLRDTTWYGSGTDECANVFDRQLRDEQDVKG